MKTKGFSGIKNNGSLPDPHDVNIPDDLTPANYNKFMLDSKLLFYAEQYEGYLPPYLLIVCSTI